MSERYVIVSDLHLGKHHHRLRAEMLRPLWQGAQHLIVNGDVAELFDIRFVEKAKAETLKLQELCAADGVTLTLLAGNHDPDVAEERFLFLLDGKVLVTHGDSVDPAIAPWCRTAPVMREKFYETMNSFPVETRERLVSRLNATRAAAKAKWAYLQYSLASTGLKHMIKHPWKFFAVIRYWVVFPSKAALFLERYAPTARVMVAGHSHRQGIWTRGARTIINTGAYEFPAKPRVVVLEGNSLAVHRAIEADGAFRLEEVPLRILSL